MAHGEKLEFLRREKILEGEEHVSSDSISKI